MTVARLPRIEIRTKAQSTSATCPASRENGIVAGSAALMTATRAAAMTAPQTAIRITCQRIIPIRLPIPVPIAFSTPNSFSFCRLMTKKKIPMMSAVITTRSHSTIVIVICSA